MINIIYSIFFLYIVLMYLKYIFNVLEIDKRPIEYVFTGLLIGNLSIFLVLFLSPHNFLTYLNPYLIYFEDAKDQFIIKGVLEMTPFNFELLRNYIFTGFTEELAKLSACVLTYVLFFKYKLKNVYIYMILSGAFFALIENIKYLTIYGPEVFIVRSIFPTTTHICLGLILGYFLILGLTKKMKYTILYSTLGLFITTFLHGTFNLTIYMGYEWLNHLTWTFIVVLGLILLNKSKKFFIN